MQKMSSWLETLRRDETASTERVVKMLNAGEGKKDARGEDALVVREEMFDILEEISILNKKEEGNGLVSARSYNKKKEEKERLMNSSAADPSAFCRSVMAACELGDFLQLAEEIWRLSICGMPKQRIVDVVSKCLVDQLEKRKKKVESRFSYVM